MSKLTLHVERTGKFGVIALLSDGTVTGTAQGGGESMWSIVCYLCAFLAGFEEKDEAILLTRLSSLLSLLLLLL